DGAFGRRLRELRNERGLGLRAVALSAFTSKTQLGDYETGKRRPSADTVVELDRVLDARGELIELYRATDPDRKDQADPLNPGVWRRPDSENLADLLVRVPPDPSNALQIAHQWLITDPPQAYEMRTGRRIGVSTVEKLERRVAQLRRLDDHVGGSDTREVVTG